MTRIIRSVEVAERALRKLAGEECTINVSVHRRLQHTRQGSRLVEAWSVKVTTDDRVQASVSGAPTLAACMERVRRAIVSERVARVVRMR